MSKAVAEANSSSGRISRSSLKTLSPKPYHRREIANPASGKGLGFLKEAPLSQKLGKQDFLS